MTTPSNAFELLQDEIQKEAKLESKHRSIEYRKETLEYFLEHQKTTADHDLWRECFMHEGMLVILNQRFDALNPHKKGEVEYESALAGSFNDMPDKKFQILYGYTQEVDENWGSQEEIDKATTTKQPNISRLELEVQAAEKYIVATWGIAKKQPSRIDAEERKSRKPVANLNPVLNWEELKEELGSPNISVNSINKNVERNVKRCYKKVCLPWAIGGCVSEYQIVGHQLKDGIDHPTPDSCKYQKISLD